jgi:hypothetical protein
MLLLLLTVAVKVTASCSPAKGGGGKQGPELQPQLGHPLKLQQQQQHRT